MTDAVYMNCLSSIDNSRLFVIDHALDIVWLTSMPSNDVSSFMKGYLVSLIYLIFCAPFYSTCRPSIEGCFLCVSTHFFQSQRKHPKIKIITFYLNLDFEYL